MWIVAGYWKLHDGFGLDIDNVKPLYGFHIAEQFAWNFYSSLKNLWKWCKN